MGLLGKLFGDDDIDKKVKGFFGSITNGLQRTRSEHGTRSEQRTLGRFLGREYACGGEPVQLRAKVLRIL